MIKGSVILFMALGASVRLTNVFAAEAPAASPVASWMAQADAAYAKRAEIPEAKIALFYYEKLVKADSTTVEACWKASRTAWWIGDHAEKRAEKLDNFQKGVDLAKEAIARNPNSAEAHYWLGGNLGSFGETKGILKSLFLIKPIRYEMTEVNRLNDRYDGGGGYRILGIMDYKVPGFAGGNKKRALEELNKALAIDPNNPHTHYYLAEYYSVIGEDKKAREENQTLQALTPQPDDGIDLRTMQEKGRKLVEKL